MVPMALLKALSVLLVIHVRRPDRPTGGASRWQIGLSISLRLEALAASTRRTFMASIWAVVHVSPSKLVPSICRLQRASDGAIHALCRRDLARHG